MMGVMGLMRLVRLGRLMGRPRLMGLGSMRRPMIRVMGPTTATDATRGDPLFKFVDQQLNFIF